MPALASQLLRFALVGGLATGIHYAVALVLVLNFTVPVLVASSIGFVLSAVVNYSLNARLTFGARSRPLAQKLRFVVAAGFGLVLNYAVLGACLRLDMWPPLAQVVATLFTLLANFGVNAAWVFRRTPKPTGNH